jgi:two-component system, NtrC family, response regulator HydG
MTSEQLPLRLREIRSWPSLAEFAAGQEKQYMDRVVRACNGDKAAAAKVLGIDPSKLG